MKKRIRLTDKETVDIVTSYQTDLTPVVELSERYGVTRQGIYRVLKRAGIDTTKEGAAHIAVSCTCCGVEVIKPRYRIRKARSIFCGEKCYFAWLKHGNGNPLVVHRSAGRHGRKVVEDFHPLRPSEVVHHEDRNQWNNHPSNLKVFANQGDHLRYHRGFLVPIIWQGK